MRGRGLMARVYESGRLASLNARSSSSTRTAWRMRSAGWARLKRSCQRWRGAASVVRFVMSAHRTGDVAQRPEPAASMRTMTELLATMRRHRQALFALGMIVIVILLLWTARGALPAFFIGLALAFILDPAVTILARHGMPRWAGVVGMYHAVVALRWARSAVFGPPPRGEEGALLADHPDMRP